jgi:rhodanese-related sulfurtransferase
MRVCECAVPELSPKEVLAISQRVGALSAEERALPTSLHIIDVRTDAEWRAGRIAGSQNASFLPPWSFADR